MHIKKGNALEQKTGLLFHVVNNANRFGAGFEIAVSLILFLFSFCAYGCTPDNPPEGLTQSQRTGGFAGGFAENCR